MKLYYHPVSTTSRPVVLFATESGIDLEYEVVDLFTGAHYQPEYAAINPSRQVPVLEDGDFPPDRELGDPQVPRRQDRLARLSEGPAQARARQRADGLAQHRLLPRLFLRHALSADLSVHEARRRHGAGRHARLGQGEGAQLAQGAGRRTDRTAQRLPLRRRHHDRRLPRLDDGVGRRGHPVPVRGVSEHLRAGSAT